MQTGVGEGEGGGGGKGRSLFGVGVYKVEVGLIQD